MLVADWLALLRVDPGLPRELLDDDWPADLSLSIYRELRARTTEPATREFAALVAHRPRKRAMAT
jgi:phenylacetic acid degradation operon negative regulatory protein